MYVKPTIQIITFDTEDVILTSSETSINMGESIGSNPVTTTASIETY